MMSASNIFRVDTRVDSGHQYALIDLNASEMYPELSENEDIHI